MATAVSPTDVPRIVVGEPGGAVRAASSGTDEFLAKVSPCIRIRSCIRGTTVAELMQCRSRAQAGGGGGDATPVADAVYLTHSVCGA